MEVVNDDEQDVPVGEEEVGGEGIGGEHDQALGAMVDAVIARVNELPRSALTNLVAAACQEMADRSLAARKWS